MTPRKAGGKAGLAPRRPGTFAKGRDPRRNVTKPGTGRIPSLVRAHARGAFATRIPLLERIADGKLKTATVADRLRAIDQLAKYGLGTERTVRIEGIEGIDAFFEMVQQVLHEQFAERAGAAIDEIQRRVLVLDNPEIVVQ
jgi:hypothetical protein